VTLVFTAGTASGLTLTELTHFPNNTLEQPFEKLSVFNCPDLAHWQQLLTEIKKAQSTCDMSKSQRLFGVCVIDYEQVQARVTMKYNSWQ
jgi:hypothetical protein